jgi:hypothetical protein
MPGAFGLHWLIVRRRAQPEELPECAAGSSLKMHPRGARGFVTFRVSLTSFAAQLILKVVGSAWKKQRIVKREACASGLRSRAAAARTNE